MDADTAYFWVERGGESCHQNCIWNYSWNNRGINKKKSGGEFIKAGGTEAEIQCQWLMYNSIMSIQKYVLLSSLQP